MNIFPIRLFIPQLLFRNKRKLLKNGAPGEIRTPDRPVRSRVLYPAELRAQYLVVDYTAALGGGRRIIGTGGGEF